MGKGISITTSVIKSKGFLDNLNAKRMEKQIEKNTYKSANVVLTTAIDKYIPVATGNTKKETSNYGVKKTKNGYEMRSPNYNGTRYNKKTPNKGYKTKYGVFIPAGANADKYEWFHRAYQLKKEELDKVQKEDVLK